MVWEYEYIAHSVMGNPLFFGGKSPSPTTLHLQFAAAQGHLMGMLRIFFLLFCQHAELKSAF